MAPAYVIERAAGTTALYVDLDGDKQVTDTELHELEASADRLHAGITTVRFPLPSGTFRTYPVRVYVCRKQKDETSRIVGVSPRAYVRCRVDLGRRILLVEYEFDRSSNSIALANGWQGMD